MPLEEREGSIPSVRVGKRVLFFLDDLNEYLTLISKQQQQEKEAQKKPVERSTEREALATIERAVRVLQNAEKERRWREEQVIRLPPEQRQLEDLARQIQTLTMEVEKRDKLIQHLSARIAMLEANSDPFGDAPSLDIAEAAPDQD